MALRLSVRSALLNPAAGSDRRLSAVAAAVRTFRVTRCFSSQNGSSGKVNLEQSKDSTKVVHSFDVEDIGKRAVYCRCWRSKKKIKHLLYGSSLGKARHDCVDVAEV